MLVPDQEKALAVLARYLRAGWSGVNSYDMVALGFDPFRSGPISELAFRQRAAELVDTLASNNLVED